MTAFLVACAVVFTFGYGVPLAIVPLGWARRLGWTVRPDPLTIYFGRCLGCLIIAISAAAVRVAFYAPARPIMLELLALAFGAMVVVHAVGWIRRTQPRLESLELPVFVLLTIATIWLRFAAL